MEAINEELEDIALKNKRAKLPLKQYLNDSA